MRTPELKATLVLTSNEEPHEALVRDVMAAGAAHQIEVSIWSRSRLAHVLDNTPAGQWVRWKLLGVTQELLSSELLAELSKTSLDAFRPSMDDPRAWVPRQLDQVLRLTRLPINFIVSESGLGKTVACYRTVLEHVDQGGYGLILPHELVAQTSTLEQAVSEAIRQPHPRIAPGQSPLSVCSPERPLMILVEDITRSGRPELLVTKLARWGLGAAGSEMQSATPWRVFCPVWPRVLNQMEDLARKVVNRMLISPAPMTEAEASQAIVVRAALSGRSISEVRANEISTALGHDPLLIALHDFDRDPNPRSVLTRFVESALARAQEDSDETSADFRHALMELAEQMLHRKRLELSWQELSSWDLPLERSPNELNHGGFPNRVCL